MLLASDGTDNKLISSGYNELGQLGHTSDTNTVNFDEVDLTRMKHALHLQYPLDVITTSSGTISKFDVSVEVLFEKF